MIPSQQWKPIYPLASKRDCRLSCLGSFFTSFFLSLLPSSHCDWAVGSWFSFFLYCTCRYAHRFNVSSRGHRSDIETYASCWEDGWGGIGGMASQVGGVYDFDALFCHLSAQRVSSVICIRLERLWVCVCVCVSQFAGCVFAADMALGPTCFWGEEDRRKINSSTWRATASRCFWGHCQLVLQLEWECWRAQPPRRHFQKISWPWRWHSTLGWARWHSAALKDPDMSCFVDVSTCHGCSCFLSARLSPAAVSP